jgi:hypothetical protein
LVLLVLARNHRLRRPLFDVRNVAQMHRLVSLAAQRHTKQLLQFKSVEIREFDPVDEWLIIYDELLPRENLA